MICSRRTQGISHRAFDLVLASSSNNSALVASVSVFTTIHTEMYLFRLPAGYSFSAEAQMMKAPAQHLFKNLSAANPELHNDSRGRVDVRVCRPNTSRRGICSRSYHTTSSQLASFAFHQIGNPPYCPVELFKLPNPRDAVGFGC